MKKNSLNALRAHYVIDGVTKEKKRITKNHFNDSGKQKAFSAYVLINVEARSEEIVLEKIKLQGINDIHKVLGLFHIIIKIEVDSKDELRELLHLIRCLDGIKSTLTLVTRDKETNAIVLRARTY
jgi:hypothetical protein